MPCAVRTAWTFAGLLVVSVAAFTAGAANRFVAPSGTDAGNDCLTAATPCATVSHATSQAASGDTINVASGQLRDNVRIASSTSLTFLGGWDATFASRDARGTPSVLRGGRVPTAFRHRDRVWGIFADAGAAITVTIDGFVLEKGRAGTDVAPDIPVAFQGLAGGGLAAVASDNSSITLQLRNTLIIQNRDAYSGAGVSVWAFGNSSLDAALESVRVLKNRSTGGAGGVLASSPAYPGGPGTVSLRLTNCVVAGNEGTDGGGGIAAGNGGVAGSALTLDIVSSTITQNLVRGPRTLTPGSPPPDVFGGGGIWASGSEPLTVSLTDTILLGNTLRGVGTGADFLEPAYSYATQHQLTLNASHTDLGDVSLHGGTFNDLGGNVAVDPQLDATYELLPGSPLIDAGTCTGAPSTDFEGDPRPSGAGCDIGADEFQF